MLLCDRMLDLSSHRVARRRSEETGGANNYTEVARVNPSFYISTFSAKPFNMLRKFSTRALPYPARTVQSELFLAERARRKAHRSDAAYKGSLCKSDKEGSNLYSDMCIVRFSSENRFKKRSAINREGCRERERAQSTIVSGTETRS